MIYVLTFFLPFIALWGIGRKGHALINIPLFILAWAPGMVHGMIVVYNHKQREKAEQRATEERRHQELLDAARAGR